MCPLFLSMALIPPQPVGMLPGSGLWNDWIEKVRSALNQNLSSISWSIITGKPTTIAGFGIVDAQTKLNNSAGLAAALSDETGTGLSVFNTAPTINNVLLTGTISTAGTPGISTTITTAKLTGAGTNGSMTFTNGILTAQTPAT